MVALGVRCWKDRIALVVVEEAPDGPTVRFSRRQKAPSSSDPGEVTAWFGKMTEEAIQESGATVVSVRIADTSPEQGRAHAEGAVLAAAYRAGATCKTYRRQSLMKPLGVARTTGAWDRFQKVDPFIGSLVGEEKDAAMASLAATR